jgi:hypothetical protein
MNSPLETQRKRLVEELAEAETQLGHLKQQAAPNRYLIDYYQSTILRTKQLIESLDQHIHQQERATAPKKNGQT